MEEFFMREKKSIKWAQDFLALFKNKMRKLVKKIFSTGSNEQH